MRRCELTSPRCGRVLVAVERQGFAPRDDLGLATISSNRINLRANKRTRIKPTNRRPSETTLHRTRRACTRRRAGCTVLGELGELCRPRGVGFVPKGQVSRHPPDRVHGTGRHHAQRSRCQLDCAVLREGVLRLHQLHPKVTINYSPAGSSVGIKDIQENTVDFGDSEIPMSASAQAAAKGAVLAGASGAGRCGDQLQRARRTEGPAPGRSHARRHLRRGDHQMERSRHRQGFRSLEPSRTFRSCPSTAPTRPGRAGISIST